MINQFSPMLVTGGPMYLSHIMRISGSFGGNKTHDIKGSNLNTLEYSFTDKEVDASPCSWMLPPRCPRANFTDNGERTTDLR